MELTPREQAALSQLEMLIRQGKSEAEAAETMRVLMDDDPLVDRILRFRHDVAEQLRTIAIDRAIFDPEEGSAARIGDI